MNKVKKKKEKEMAIIYHSSTFPKEIYISDIDKILQEQEDKKDISDSPKIKAEVTFDYRIREDFTHNVIGEFGSKTILVTPQNYKKIGTLFWKTVIESLDINFYIDKKGDTNLKFYLEADFALKTTGGSYTFRIYFDVDKAEKKFVIKGWSFNNIVSTSSSLKELDVRLGKLFETAFNL